MTQTISLRITYNGVDLTDNFARESLLQALDDVASRAQEKALQAAADHVWSLTLTNVRVVSVRPASCKSCLWRHSFDWRNRERGHVTHRGTK